MNIASSSSAGAASSNPNDAKIEKLEAERDLLKAKRELVEKVLEQDEGNRTAFCVDTSGCKGLKAYRTDDQLIAKENSLSQEISELNQAIHDLRTVSSGKYPIVADMFLHTSTLTHVCF